MILRGWRIGLAGILYNHGQVWERISLVCDVDWKIHRVNKAHCHLSVVSCNEIIVRVLEPWFLIIDLPLVRIVHESIACRTEQAIYYEQLGYVLCCLQWGRDESCSWSEVNLSADIICKDAWKRHLWIAPRSCDDYLRQCEVWILSEVHIIPVGILDRKLRTISLNGWVEWVLDSLQLPGEYDCLEVLALSQLLSKAVYCDSEFGWEGGLDWLNVRQPFILLVIASKLRDKLDAVCHLIEGDWEWIGELNESKVCDGCCACLVEKELPCKDSHLNSYVLSGLLCVETFSCLKSYGWGRRRDVGRGGPVIQNVNREWYNAWHLSD